MGETMSGLETEHELGKSNLHIEWNPDIGTVALEPRGPLTAHDFDRLASIVDPWIKEHGKLHGIVVHVKGVPGWNDFESFIRHIRFVRDHHQQVEKVALVTDSIAMELFRKIGAHFINAEVKQFEYDDLTDAKIWVGTPGARLH